MTASQAYTTVTGSRRFLILCRLYSTQLGLPYGLQVTLHTAWTTDRIRNPNLIYKSPNSETDTVELYSTQQLQITSLGSVQLHHVVL